MAKSAKTAMFALLLVIVLAVCATLVLGGSEKQEIQEGNLIANGDFSAVTGGMPDDWETGMWVIESGVSYLESVTFENGEKGVMVENAASNDARFEQTVAVRENAIYRLTAQVAAEDCGESTAGANLSFLGVYGMSESLYDTDGAFKELNVYGRTGKGQRELTVCLRLGGYGAENTGRAYFKNVELTQVDSVPVGAQIIELKTPQPQKEKKEEAKETGSPIPALMLLGAAYLLMSAAVTLTLLRGPKKTMPRGMLPVLLSTAALVRFGIAATVEGYGVDMGCFGAWAGKMAADGPVHFYEEGYFCDYPPAYMLVLGLLGLIAKLLHLSLSSMAGQFLLKTVPILCDLALAGAAYAVAHRRIGERAAAGLSLLLAFNPAFVVTGSAWGQIDSVLALLLVVMLLFAKEGRWQFAIPVFALAVLTKPQAGLLAPLGMASLVKEGLDRAERRRNLRRIGWGLGAGVLVTLAITLPFSPKQSSALWLVDKYVQTLSSYDYATLSTGNLMFLLGGNWVKNTESVLGTVNYGQMGMALMALSFLAGILIYAKGKGRERLFTASAATMQLIFVLGTKMHERYILPALALLLLAYLETEDMRLLLAAILASAATTVNVGVVLALEYLIAPNLWLGYGLSVVQLVAAALTVWTAVSLCAGGAPMRLPERSARKRTPDKASDDSAFAADARLRDELLHAKDYKLRLKKRDYAIMLGLTAVYAAVAFYQLGATDAPQNGYASTAANETVVLDLGERHEDFRIYYYGGISDTQFSFAVSDDGTSFGEENDAFLDRGECFKWMALRKPSYDERGKVTGASGGMLTFSGRYLRVTFKGAGAALWEVAAVTATGEVIPAVSAQANGALEGRAADPMALIDEQETVPEKPSYYNSMYFDEIYHARTGYEHANSLYAYETTHPPLGKVFISWCISLLGMTPFAWRLAGTICGVLMVPAMYLLAMTLFGRTRWATLCALLLTADCMHFTQTRIATIDSYPVLFIMLMFMFMARWMKMSFYHQRLRDTLVPLALSGVCMGLAIASKWIGCYSAVGLAILFFARFYALWRQSVYAGAHRDEAPAFERAASLFAKNGAKTIAACCVFFVAIPVAIYVLSYIPYLRAYGEVKWNLRTLERIWDAQVLMFDYHKNLVAEHYFASPWYEWPLIVKPMWYFAADFEAPGMVSSILAFGNPAVWWTGLAGMLFVLIYSIYRNALPALRVLPGRENSDDRAMPVIAVGFLSAYLPWVLVSRLTFIYHYFASVPFIILATAQALRYLERKNARLAHGLMLALSVAAIALFVAFYPLASGMEVPRAWCDAMNWFDGWMWY